MPAVEYDQQLELAQIAIQFALEKNLLFCALLLLRDYLGPNVKKKWQPEVIGSVYYADKQRYLDSYFEKIVKKNQSSGVNVDAKLIALFFQNTYGDFKNPEKCQIYIW